MFDIGWPELLVVAIVLIVVVGPKDLPPMLRAFGRTTKKLRAMASEFRGQFDDALREAELDDVKKTFDDARKLNPMQNLRDAVNPLKDTAKDIKADLEKSVKTPSSAAAEQPKMEAPEPTMKLDDGPPEFTAGWPASKPAEAAAKPDPKATAAEKTPAAKPAAAKTVKAPTPAKAKTSAAKAKPAAAKTAAAPKAAAVKTAAPKSAAKATTSAAKAKAPAKPAPAKSAPRAKKPKGEGQA
ncbi:Sec-independent protein translocase protein TatB [uncultured Hoeflea sp.]|uniref:Sec-independent protein translocase protein TatB n=1 Tax=uncultured Hoeflea sp. TaxID=538666 RepID=UPI0030DA14E7